MKITNLEPNIPEPLLGIAGAESAVPFRTDFPPLKLLHCVDEPVDARPLLLRMHPATGAGPRAGRNPLPVHERNPKTSTEEETRNRISSTEPVDASHRFQRNLHESQAPNRPKQKP